MEKQHTPKLGHSVFIPFVTDGEGTKVKGAALIPFDKIVAVYDSREQINGKTAYSVQVSSGDVVTVVLKDVEQHQSGAIKSVTWSAVA
jgi:hypothetical protein